METYPVTRTSTKHSQRRRNSNLTHAARSGKYDEVKELLQSRAEIDCEGEGGGLIKLTALSLAAQYGHVQIVELLLKKDADFEKKDEHKRTPLSLAAEEGHREVVQLLVEWKATIETRNWKRQTPLSLASENGHSEVVRLLLEKDADFEKEDEWNRPPLSLAARYGYAQIVELLLQKKAKVDKRDEDSRTPLSLAAERGHTEVAELLLENEADIEEECSGQTPLSFAAENGNLEIVEFLLEKKAEMTEDLDRPTPFDLAKGNGHDKVAVLLLRHESKGDWNMEQLRSLIKLHNQDVIVEEIQNWPKAAKQIQKRQGGVGNYSMSRAALPERLRPVLAPIEENPDGQTDENCVATLHSSNVEDLSQENFFWAPEVAVTLKVLLGVDGSDAINKKFLQTLADTPHDAIFETDAMQAMILAAWQQERFSTWFGIASCIAMVLCLCGSSYGFRHDEDAAETFLYVAAVFHFKKSLNEFFQLAAHLAKKCSHEFKRWNCSHWCFESLKSKINDWYSPSYINFDNVADMFYIGLGWAAILRPPGYEKPCMALFCGLSWLRLVYSLRGETWIGPRLLPILSAIKDTFAFFFLLTICIVAASHAYYNLELRDEPSPSYAAIMQIVRLGIFGDFDMFEFENEDPTYTQKDPDTASVWEPQDPSPGKHYESVHALFYITGLGITVLLMNMLISVLSESYSKYAEKQKATGQFFRARLKILVDVQLQPERCVWNLVWKHFKSMKSVRESSLNSRIWDRQGLKRLRGFLCCALFALPWVIWFLFYIFDLNISCLLCQLRYARGYFGYAPLRDETPDQEPTDGRAPKTKLKKEKHEKKRPRAAAEQCAIFFVVRDQPDLNESLDARMQRVEKTVQGMDSKMETSNDVGSLQMELEQRMDNKMETLEQRLGGQIKTGFEQIRERRRRRPPFEMQADDG